MTDGVERLRVRVRVRGTVQGVGFRPFVYRRAVGLGLSGWVGNDGSSVVLEVEGRPTDVATLVQALREEAPPLARVEDVETVTAQVQGGVGFAVAASSGSSTDLQVSADVAPCVACLAELGDPGDRRHGYPFINCTDCGPRYTIVRDVPYDRPATTMASFDLCATCQAEYDDPGDRRFHAQPNACPTCGPTAAWTSAGAVLAGPAAVHAAAGLLASGGIVAVKGVGGYHLACDARDETAVARLRERKRRPDKPFAVMVADAVQAGLLCDLQEPERQALLSPRRPIVLAVRRPGEALAASVAPGLREVGIMLPSSPLHELLLVQVGRPLVMTSGNRGGDPVIHRDEEVDRALGPLADGVLRHDREIHVRVDDSVLRARPGLGPQVVRRARGWVPQPLRLPVAATEPVLAVGAHLKSSVTLVRGSSAVVSQHLGDLTSWPASVAFEEAIDHLVHLSGVRPALVAHDLHPDYRSTAWARACGLPLLGVQHHHAHIASCLAENGVTERVLGIAFDGVGLGTDGSLWGGELLLADLTGFTRVGHLAPVALPGGDMAVREPWRVAVAWLLRALGPDAVAEHASGWDVRWASVLSLAASGRAPETTSVGRLFDTVAVLVGLRTQVTYEGQAAIELEALARRGNARRAATYGFHTEDGILDPAPLLHALLADRAAGVAAEDMAAGFHRSLAEAAGELATTLASTHAVGSVALSGGVFSNVLLSALLTDRLERAGLRVLQHEQVPCNDGGISLGQAAVAAASSRGPSLAG